MIGQGGFGRVALCKNKLDGRQYAVKKIRLKDRSPQVNEKILRFLYVESYLLVEMCCRIMLLFFPFHVLIWNFSLWSKQKSFLCLLLGPSLLHLSIPDLLEKERNICKLQNGNYIYLFCKKCLFVFLRKKDMGRWNNLANIRVRNWTYCPGSKVCHFFCKILQVHIVLPHAHMSMSL